jgi:preprotein translocase subunit SecB
MTKKQSSDQSAANGAAAPAPSEPQMAPGPIFSALTQYAKDFSFENPNAPRSLAPQTQPPQITINVNVGGQGIAEGEVESTLTIEGKAEINGELLFRFELSYCGVFRILNFPAEQMHPLVMIECPRFLFPFARQIISDAVRNGGFPPLYIDPVDFAGLYQQRMLEAQQAEGEAATS